MEHLQSYNEEIYSSNTLDAINYQKLIIRLAGSFLQSFPTTISSELEVEVRERDKVDVQVQAIGELVNSQVEQSADSKKDQKEAVQPQVAYANNEETQKQAEQLRRILIAYGIAIASIDAEKTQVGPRFIRYWVKLQPPAGRLSEIQKYSVDIARELGSRTIPFIDNIPGERYVGIDLARENPETILLAQVLTQLPKEQPHQLLIALGQSPSGEDVKLDIVRLPHLLVAGSTGSGKTVFLSSLIASLVWRHPANELELLLIDPKQTDFGVFEDLPHLHNQKILYEPEDAIEALQELIAQEKEKRTKVLHEKRCRNILEYNRRNSERSLPWIVVVIDEFADIMLTLQRKEREKFERQISRLAATGRSIGIHLIIATQRPTTDVITGTIKANIPARISFRLPSVIDSRTILDQSGAENLLGQGDMLVSFNGELQRLQGYYLAYEDILRILDQIK
jgi:DNA segregation ATPase FtsK/SpoIIIE-like protein